jgi:hypothetical protein
LKKKYCLEALLVLVACILSFFICYVYGVSLEDPLDHAAPMAMNLFFPSVFFAAGHGLGTADASDIPGLEDFLLRNTDHFDIQNIPSETRTLPVSSPFELTHLYTLYLVGWFWRFFGISVHSMLLCSAFLSALAGVALFGIFRLGLRRGYSLAGVFLVVSSPVFLYTSNNLRDFAKTPFVLLALWMALFLFLKPAGLRKYLFFSLGLGIVLGMAMGIRQDVAMIVPPLALLFLVGTKFKSNHSFFWRLAAGLLFVVPFYLLSAPARYGAALEGNQAFTHSFFTGVSPDIEEKMSFGCASYDALFWTDAGLYAQANVLARRRGDTSSMANVYTAEYRQEQREKDAPRMINPNLYYTSAKYGEYGQILFLDYLKHFPADIVYRAWVSTSAFYSMPLEVCMMTKQVRASFPLLIQKIFTGHTLAAHVIRYGGLCLVLLSLLVLSARNLKIAYGLAFLILWCTGYVSVCFDTRHMAYLSFVPFLVLLAGLEWVHTCAVSGWQALRKKQHPDQIHNHFPCSEARCIFGSGEMLKKILLFSLTLCLAVVVPLVPLRLWQKQKVHSLLDIAESLKRYPVSVTAEDVQGNESSMLVRPSEPLPGLPDEDFHAPGEASWEYLAAVFYTDGADIPVTIEYDHNRFIHDSTQTVLIRGVSDAGRGTVTLFYPVYEIGTVHSPGLLEQYLHEIKVDFWREKIDPSKPFKDQDLWKSGKYLGLSFDKRFKDSFAGLYRVDPDDRLTYLPFLQVPESREGMRYFKKWQSCPVYLN